MEEQLLSVDQVSRFCDIPVDRVQEWLKSGQLVSRRGVGPGIRIHRMDLKDFLDRYLLELLRERRELREKQVPFNVLLTLCSLEQSTSAEINVTPHLLIVDDSRSFRESLVQSLHRDRPDLKVICSADGYDACQKVIHNPIQLALVDILMPGMDGIQFCRLLRSVEPLREVKIVVVSGLVSDEVQQELENLGIHHILHKPVAIQAIHKAIDQYLPSR